MRRIILLDGLSRLLARLTGAATPPSDRENQTMTESRTKRPLQPDGIRLAIVAGPGAMSHVGRLIRRLVIGLLDEMVKVTVVAPESEDVSSLPDPPVRLLRYPMGRGGHPRRKTIDRLAEQLVEHGVEILHAADSGSHPLTRRLSDFLDCPYLASVFARGQRSLLDPIGEHCRVVLAGSTAIRADLLESQVCDADRMRIVRPGVHHKRTARGAAGPSHSRAILVAGELNVTAPFETALEALAEIRRSGYECVFFLIGTGKAERRLRERAKSLGLTHHLTFVGRLEAEQLTDVLRAADVFVHPHATGTLEMDILEAMAAGVPVLTGGACVGDFVIDGQTAMSYQPHEWADLALKLKLILDGPDSSDQMTRAALAHVGEHHSPARMVSALGALCREHAVRGRTLKMP